MADDSLEQGYQALFERSPLPMWTFDRETLRFASVNDAALRHYGYTREEFLSLTIADIRPPEDIAALHEDLRTATGVAEPRLWRHRRKDGSIILVEIQANDLTIDGRMVRLVLANDVTERERARQALHRTEEQLRHAQKMEAIGRLASGVAHDFNNILTVIDSYAALIEHTFDAGDTRRDDVVEIRKASARATAITRQLLALGRRSLAQHRSIQLAEVVAGFTAILHRVVGEQISLSIEASPAPDVLADPGQLEQVLMNLAINARDAMPDGGRLSIATRPVEIAAATATEVLRAGSYVVIEVTDTGIGMHPDIQRQIFEPFFTTKPPGEGTGLGLSIIYGIVTQAGGAITVYSEPGHGTTFRIFLPVAAASVTAAPEAEIEDPRALPSVTILIVDDDESVRKVASRVLADAGCKVESVGSGGEAQRWCADHHGTLDLVLVDVVLPDSRGELLIQRLRDLHGELRVLFLSGYPVTALEVKQGERFDLLTKPFSPAQLRAAVALALGSSPVSRSG